MISYLKRGLEFVAKKGEKYVSSVASMIHDLYGDIDIEIRKNEATIKKKNNVIKHITINPSEPKVSFFNIFISNLLSS